MTKKIVNPPRQVYQYAKADYVLLNDLILKKQTGTVLSLKMMLKVLGMPSLKHFFVVSMQRYLVLQHVPNQSHGLLLTLRNLFLKID